MFLIGAALGLLAVLVLVSAGTGNLIDILGEDMSWLEPYMTVGGILFGGLALAAAMVLIGLSVGRWNKPVPVHGPDERRHEGLRE